MGGVHTALIEVAAATAGDDLVQVAAVASEVDLVDGEPARRVKLLPMGTIAMRDGRGPYRVRDLAHANEIVAATKQFFGTADMPADRDHQMAFAVKPGVGGTAPAAAWIKTANITAESDGIYANDVAWTVAAHAQLKAREYRYVSPLFMARADGDVIHLKNFALVNIGAIDLPAIAAGLSGEDETMDLTALAALLGLGADATADQVAAAIGDLKKPKVPAAIAAAAGVGDDATIEQVAAAIGTLKTAAAPDPSQFVPIAQVAGVTTRLATLEGERAEREVAAAVQAGKLAPSMKVWGLDYFKKDEAGFRAFISGTPVIVAAGALLDGSDPAKLPADRLTDDEVAAASMLGVSPADFLKARNERIAA